MTEHSCDTTKMSHKYISPYLGIIFVLSSYHIPQKNKTQSAIVSYYSNVGGESQSPTHGRAFVSYLVSFPRVALELCVVWTNGIL